MSPSESEQSLSIPEAKDIVESWLASSVVDFIEPGDAYWHILSALLLSAQVSGPLVMDAALAALALEHGATLCTTDRDFSRFEGLKLLNPIHE